MNKHGIAVRNRKTNQLIEFIECDTGRPALRMLSGRRMNLHQDYDAQEDFVDEAEIQQIKDREKVVERLEG